MEGRMEEKHSQESGGEREREKRSKGRESLCPAAAGAILSQVGTACGLGTPFPSLSPFSFLFHESGFQLQCRLSAMLGNQYHRQEQGLLECLCWV